MEERNFNLLHLSNRYNWSNSQITLV